MKNFKKLLALFLALVVSSCANMTDLPTAQRVDLNSYVGKWYQVAAIPAWFQKDCTGETTAEYELTTDNQIKVTNRCVAADGYVKTANGMARINSKYSDNSKLEVTFVNIFGLWVWLFGGDYWITHLADDYSYSVVAEPSLKYLWILSRNSTLDSAKLKELELNIKNLGYETCNVIITQPGEFKNKTLCSLN